MLACVARASTFLGRHTDAWDEATEALHIAQELGHRQWTAEISGVLAHLAAVAGDERRCHAFADDALAAPEPRRGPARHVLGTLGTGPCSTSATPDGSPPAPAWPPCTPGR
ncbi:hypothetical protein GCM10023238_06400 [Streptomyces heliomycini]